jgi:hypothetical protein
VVKVQIKARKRAGGMAQVVEHLLSKCEDLNSNHTPTKKRKKEKKKSKEVITVRSHVYITKLGAANV